MGLFRSIVTGLCLCWLAGQVQAQQLDYTQIFGADWDRAIAFEKENRHWLKPVVDSAGIDYPQAIAIVFPEIIRYSALRDKMETGLLKVLYTNLGEQYANFSIGVFQMKPSFAEKIREQASSVMGRKGSIAFKPRRQYDNIKEYRKSIVADLEDPHSQLNYLIVFIKLCEKRYKINLGDEAESIRFIATTYNYGIDKKATQVEEMASQKSFYTGIIRTESYSYSDISLFWFNNSYSDK